MAEGVEPDQGALEIRVSDAEREVVVDLLRRQASAGRLTLGEFEERLEEVYGSRTRRDLERALRELPVEPPPALSGPAGRSSGGITDADLRRRYRLRVRKDLAEFVAPNFVCNTIWFMGDMGYWWPGWVLLGTGVGLITTAIRGFDPEKERSALAAERRKQRMAEIEARHGREGPDDDDGLPEHQP